MKKLKLAEIEAIKSLQRVLHKSVVEIDTDTLEALADLALKQHEALRHYEIMLRGRVCQHDDSSWCDARCLDGGKRARQTLEKMLEDE
jgi:hypothetical protein